MEIKRIDLNYSEEKQHWFRGLVQNAYDNGWTYSSCTSEMWEDYVKRWNHFVDYLDRLRENKDLEVVKILIGEAPPFYRATKLSYERAYFYSPDETGNSPWFSAPLAIFVGNKKFNNKQEKLDALAEKGVLLLDIFPFPIIQDTEMRMDITGKFAEHLGTYFFPLVNSVISYLKAQPDGESRNLIINWGITATKYAGTQLMLGENSRQYFEINFPMFFDNPIALPSTDEIYHKNIIRFHRKDEIHAAKNKYLDIPNWTTSDGNDVPSTYFIFVVTLLFANRWKQWRQERKDQNKRYSVNAFIKFIYTNNNEAGKVTLDQINQLLAERPILPIFSTEKGRISLKEKCFFNSK